MDCRTVLHDLFRAALAAYGPEGKFDGILPSRPRGRVIVVGAGKAAARMANALRQSPVRAGNHAL
ncbi:DUF4147 domain-containing protein [Paracoccus wurundjeri]|uniref:DUF4147 domain-containing protein n=1 Tax=Paracoccus onubensis TaxID=1675788 RepID=UPI00351D9E3D